MNIFSVYSHLLFVKQVNLEMKIKLCLQFFVVYHLFLLARAIFDGINVKITQLPFIVLLRGSKIFCAGALISNRHILTAAHCVDDNVPIKVFIGTDHFYEDHKDNPQTMVIETNKTWTHEKFSLPSAVYDIGVVELPKPLKISKAIQPIIISTRKNVEDDVNDLEVITAGFGYTKNFGGASKRLHYARMKLISLDICKKSKEFYIEDLTENHICMTTIRGQPCDGDSGAPVISTKTRELIGIISFIKDAENGENIYFNDCHAALPAVATRVSSYIHWISDTTGISFSDDKKHSRIKIQKKQTGGN